MSHDHSAMASQDRGHIEHHIVGIPTYLGVFFGLMLLTALTVWVAFLDLGSFSWLHTPLALIIASVKAFIVLWWFMHVKYSVRLTWVFIASGILWLGILLAITIGDYVGRSWEPAPEGWQAAVLTDTIDRHA